MTELSPVRELPECDPRMEDGPLQFGGDWPGLFLRGDSAMNYAYHLRILLHGKRMTNVVTDQVVRGLLADLESCNLLKRRETSPALIKIGMIVQFDPKVFEHPYAPSYDAYKGHRFQVIAFHPFGHVEITCVDDPSVRVKGYVHDGELVEFRSTSV